MKKPSLIVRARRLFFPSPRPPYWRKFVCYFYFVGWDQFSLGMSICVSLPNLEIHLPFGFLRLGMEETIIIIDENDVEIKRRTVGWD